MKTNDILQFFHTKAELAKFLKVDPPQVSRFVHYGEIPSCYHKKLKGYIRAKLRKLEKKAEELL